MAKRHPKPEPFSLAELEEIAQSPALQGFDKVLQYRPILVAPSASTVEETIPSTVEVSETSTVEGGPAAAEFVPTSTVEANVSSTVEAGADSDSYVPDLWLAEGAAGVFTAKRVRRIERAQDILTHVEEAVYDAMWRCGKNEREGCRFAQLGYADLVKASRVSKRSIQSVVDRLSEKGIIAVEVPADITRRRATIYRVFGYTAILKFLRDTGRQYVVYTGRGMFYARKVGTKTVEVNSPSTVEAKSPSTVALASTVTVEARAPSTVEASAAGNTLGNPQGKTSSSGSVAAVAAKVVKLLPVDDDAVRRLIESCRQADPAATDDEIGYAAELWIHQNARNTSLRKPVAVMLTAVPKFFEPPATQIRRYREESERQAQQSRELARAILADPDAPDMDRQWANAVLGQ